MSDEYRTQGKSIAELTGLDQDDPWKPVETDEEKLLKEEIAKKKKELIDGLIKDGIIVPKQEEGAFTDPENDESLVIKDTSILSLFWKIVVPNKRLIELVDLEPSLVKITIAMRNNNAGCWLAFTSKRIAQKIFDQLVSNIIMAEMHPCDVSGNPILISDRINKVVVDEWRPWKPVGIKGSIQCRADEFFYCIAKYEDKIRAFFVPEIYWNEHKRVFDQSLDIDEMIKSHLKKTEILYCYVGWRGDLITVKTFLDRAGFRENLIFQAYINEQGF